MILTVGRVSLFTDFIRGNHNLVKNVTAIPFSFKIVEKCFSNRNEAVSHCKRSLFTTCRLFNDQSVLTKKRTAKKRKYPLSDEDFRVSAFCTAETYNLESLIKALPTSTNYKPTAFSLGHENLTDVVHAVSNSETGSESQDLFFFREGSVVLWNISDSDREVLIDFLKSYEDIRLPKDVIENESEMMPYSYSSSGNKTQIKKDTIIFSCKGDVQMEKYAISNAMALSVHLGAYESNLERYIHAMEPVTHDLKTGAEIKMTRDEVLQKTGQLFALRHKVTLSSDLLDTPDFYWDRPDLEALYQAIFNYFCIAKRTRVMNEKINHCIELVELLSSHLNDKHHVRLEWMIIILIMVEVGFEVLHYADRYLESKAVDLHGSVNF